MTLEVNKTKLAMSISGVACLGWIELVMSDLELEKWETQMILVLYGLFGVPNE